ncbi:replication initiation negative regulator SeqA [Marinobacter hydrocarbonoclasticus]|nr:replication initiation negative regulator SeqA [Marinobacter nauticus]
MKYIEIDDELYRHIASNTQQIGESASDILRRLLGLEVNAEAESIPERVSEPSLEGVEEHVPAPAPVRSAVAEAGVFDELVGDDQLERQKGAVGRFVYLLDCLYRQHPGAFDAVLNIRGRDRLYFSQSKEALLKASPSANPKQIGASPFWVSANNNTAKKRAILEEVLDLLGCQKALATQIAEQI